MIKQGNGNFIMESNNGIFFFFLLLLLLLYFYYPLSRVFGGKKERMNIKTNEMTTTREGRTRSAY